MNIGALEPCTLHAHSRWASPVSTIGMKKPRRAVGHLPDSLSPEVSVRPLAGIDQPLLRRLFRYWSGKRAGRDLPARQDIDPVEIGPAILPHIMLTDVLEGGRLRYRLAGTAVEAVTGQSLSGHYLDELLRPPYRDYILALYAEVIERRCALYTESLYPLHGRQPERLTKRLMMPLVSEDDAVVMVLSGQVFKSITDLSYSPPLSPIPSVYKELLRLVL